MFNDILKTQLILKKIIAEEDWYTVSKSIQYDYLQDGHFAELKDTELLRNRLDLARDMRDYVGKYYSVEYIRKHILKQNEKEIDDMDQQIKKEIDDGIIASPEEQNTGGFNE